MVSIACCFYHITYVLLSVILKIQVLPVFYGFGYLLELSAARNWIKSEQTLLALQIVNIACSVIVPSTLIWVIQPAPGIFYKQFKLTPLPASGILLMLLVTVVHMKLISYAHINHNLRVEARTKKKANGWPDNITLSSKS